MDLVHIRGKTTSQRRNSNESPSNNNSLMNDIVPTGSSISTFHEQNFGDQKIDVLGLSSKQMALIYFGFSW